MKRRVPISLCTTNALQQGLSRRVALLKIRFENQNILKPRENGTPILLVGIDMPFKKLKASMASPMHKNAR